jgi:hypothetical protein
LNVETRLASTFENGFALTDIATLEGQRPTPGGLLTFTLFGARPPSDELGALKLTAQLLNADGALVAQQDTPLAEWHPGNARSISRSYGLLLPAELTPGRYRLIAAVYDAAAEDLPRLRTSDGADVVELGVVEIGRLRD